MQELAQNMVILFAPIRAVSDLQKELANGCHRGRGQQSLRDRSIGPVGSIDVADTARSDGAIAAAP
jgi:hypothetical protein